MSYQRLREWHLCGHAIQIPLIFTCYHLYTKGGILTDQHGVNLWRPYAWRASVCKMTTEIGCADLGGCFCCLGLYAAQM